VIVSTDGISVAAAEALSARAPSIILAMGASVLTPVNRRVKKGEQYKITTSAQAHVITLMVAVDSIVIPFV